MLFLYWLGRAFYKMIFICFGRMEVRGAEHVPRRGGLVVVCNHSTNWDPPLVGASLHRQIYFMAKESLFHPPLFGMIMRAIGAFPVRRGQADRGAIREALDILSKGNVLGIFPEGSRGSEEVLRQARNGAAMFALKTGVPILPMAATGTKRLFHFSKVRVLIGEPFVLEPDPSGRLDRVTLEKASAQIMEHIGVLWQELRDIG